MSDLYISHYHIKTIPIILMCLNLTLQFYFVTMLCYKNHSVRKRCFGLEYPLLLTDVC